MTDITLTKDRLVESLTEQREDFKRLSVGTERNVLPRLINLLDNPFIVVVSGLRRSGKSTLIRQLVDKQLGDNYYYVNFDDERLITFKAEHFSNIEKVLMSEFGDKKYYIFDEVQNVDKWELFVRRLYNQGKKVIVTGSNAALLSKELGTRLTGRHVTLNVFPFAFDEYLRFRNVKKLTTSTIKDKVISEAWLDRYLREGGVPMALQYPSIPVIKQLYQDILQRDVITRFGITSERELQEFSLNLISNTASLVSLNKLKQVIKIGSVTTLSNYLDYLVKSWLIGVVNRYSYSVKTQQIAPKKVYVGDPGFVKEVGFSFSGNQGKLLETIVYWDLVRLGKEIYYYKTLKGFEVDFYLPKENRLIQVCAHNQDQQTIDREERALTEATAELKNVTKSEIVTMENYFSFHP